MTLTEHQEQAALLVHVALLAGRWPELHLLYAIPNGGARSKAAAGKLKAEGVKPGVPDLCLPVPRSTWHGLYLEMKRERGGALSDPQKWWIAELARQGYRVVRCNGREAAVHEIESYLRHPRLTEPPKGPPPVPKTRQACRGRKGSPWLALLPPA